MKRPLQGRYVKVTTAGEAFQAYVPAPLPPKPPIHWNNALHAVLSSMIEGTKSSLSDLMLYELDEQPGN